MKHQQQAVGQTVVYTNENGVKERATITRVCGKGCADLCVAEEDKPIITNQSDVEYSTAGKKKTWAYPPGNPTLAEEKK